MVEPEICFVERKNNINKMSQHAFQILRLTSQTELKSVISSASKFVLEAESRIHQHPDERDQFTVQDKNFDYRVTLEESWGRLTAAHVRRETLCVAMCVSIASPWLNSMAFCRPI